MTLATQRNSRLVGPKRYSRAFATRTGGVSCRDSGQLRFFERWGLRRPYAEPRSSHLGSPPPVQDDEDIEVKMRRLEAILFLAREPLLSRKISQFASLADGVQARILIRRLNEKYDAQGRAFRIEEMAGGFRLLTRRQFATWLKRLRHVPGDLRFSTPALEILAVVAYRQPVLRADIEAVRGVNCGEMLRQLLERDQIRVCGRSEELGRPYLYGTTKYFLQVFGLKSLEALPRSEWLQQTNKECCHDGQNTD